MPPTLPRPPPTADRVAPTQVVPQLCAAPQEDGHCGEWRTRHVLACQLPQLLEAAGPGLAEGLLPCALTLCDDPVWAVRQAAAGQIGRMLAGLVPVLEAEGAGDGQGSCGEAGVVGQPQATEVAGAESMVEGAEGAGAGAAAGAPAGSASSGATAGCLEGAGAGGGGGDEAGALSGAGARAAGTYLSAAQAAWRRRVIELAEAAEHGLEAEGGAGGTLGVLGGWLAAASEDWSSHRARQLVVAACAAAVPPGPPL